MKKKKDVKTPALEIPDICPEKPRVIKIFIPKGSLVRFMDYRIRKSFKLTGDYDGRMVRNGTEYHFCFEDLTRPSFPTRGGEPVWLRVLGHQVDKYDWTDAYPKRTAAAVRKLEKK